MFRRGKSEAPQGKEEGLLSSILLQHGDVSSDQLSISWVDVAPGSVQRPHRHKPEQVYVIVRGRGRMRVENEEEDVSEGDLVWIPSNALHGIENRSGDVLSYISAATPAFDLTAFYENRRRLDRSR